MNINAIIVDDEQWNREIIKTFGNWEQNEIHLAGEAEDGEEAIRLIESGNVHIVIMDMNMPGVDGIGLLKYLNDHHPEIRIIVISGYDDYMYTRQAIRCKADEYLLKPVDPQELSQVLLQCRDRAAETLQNHPAAGTGLRLELLQALQAAKPALSAHYNDLNAAGVQDSLRELEEQLAELDVDKPALPRIGQELTLLLEELMEGNSQEDTGELETSVYKGVVSASELIRHLTEQYLSALEHLVLQRKNKNRLNLEEIKHFVDQHYTENLKVETLAKSFFCEQRIFEQSI